MITQNMHARYSKHPCSIRFDEQTLRLANRYIQQQNFPPSLSTIVRVALDKFLAEKMYDL